MIFHQCPDAVVAHLPQVQLQYVADVVRRGLGQLHQLFAVLKRLAQLLHPRLHPIHTINTLTERRIISIILHFYWPRSAGSERTFILSALLSISPMHFLMMKGMLSGLLPDTCKKSCPNSWRRPWSFLWPHWMAKVSKQRLWQAREHCQEQVRL